LIVWGENSAAEYGSSNAVHEGNKLDAAWLKTYGVTHGTRAADWVDEDLSAKDLTAYFGPNPDELERAGIRAEFLGHYFPWDAEESFSVAKAHGFQESAAGARTGFYDYADIDDDFISIHHWMKWYKFGFTRLFDNLSLEIRNRRMTRDEAVDIIRRTGEQRPLKDIRRFCDFAGIAVEEFFSIAERFRNTAIWHRSGDAWTIRDFLIPDWNWNAQRVG
jgi:hypothetical protein